MFGYVLLMGAADGSRLLGLSRFSASVALMFMGIGIFAGLIIGVKRYGKKDRG
ncbi:MAG: hypothetical protein FWC76_03905 [Defluviitaleaceae bacterium]|nr:hypothetical protein [Defluviitaleaceae bacterium]